MVRAFGRLTALALLLALALSLVTSTFGPSAYADGPNAVFQGFVVSDPLGVPVRVRAVSLGGAVCGTADVLSSGEGVGFYTLSAITAATKTGCPQAGGVLRFILVYGRIDEGVAVASAVLTPGTVAVLHLFDAREDLHIGAFAGDLPAPGGRALLRWAGPDRTPIDQALATLGFSVGVVYRYNSITGGYDAYVTSGAGSTPPLAAIGAGDEVIVERSR